MKRQTKATAKEMTADEIIENSAEFVAREAAQGATCIPMNDPEYWALVGDAFMTFFCRHPFGETEKYAWERRTPDGLNNQWIWRKRQ